MILLLIMGIWGLGVFITWVLGAMWHGANFSNNINKMRDRILKAGEDKIIQEKNRYSVLYNAGYWDAPNSNRDSHYKGSHSNEITKVMEYAAVISTSKPIIFIAFIGLVWPMGLPIAIAYTQGLRINDKKLASTQVSDEVDKEIERIRAEEGWLLTE